MNAQTINILNKFEPNITKLDICDKDIKGILDLGKFTQLITLTCTLNSITQIINLPPTLVTLDCMRNEIKVLDNLPKNLKGLNCSANLLSELDNLPTQLEWLDCGYNYKIKSLDFLPSSILKLVCSECDIQYINCLPINLTKLYCQNNNNIILDNLPEKLELVVCSKEPVSVPINCQIQIICFRNDINEPKVKKKFPNVQIRYIM
jgi:hypothetical protein